MSKWKEFFKVFQKNPITFVESYHEHDDIYTFVFEKPDSLKWRAGQQGLYDITHKDIKDKTRPFSIPVIPSENRLQITTRIRENKSDFKQALLELKPGMQISLSGPVGFFYLDNTDPTLLIAGGIGVTPFRSILRKLEEDKNPSGQSVTLLYLDSDQKYLFKEDLNRIALVDGISILYLKNREELFNHIHEFAAHYGNNGNYFMSGPTPFIDSVSSALKENNISKRRMKKDDFYGYR